MRRTSSILLTVSLILSSFVALMAQSNLEVIWSTKFKKKIEYIWSLSNSNHLVLRADKNFYLVNMLDGSIIWQKEYKHAMEVYVIKEKNILGIMGTSGLLLLNPISRKEIPVSIEIKDIEYISALNAFIILDGGSNIVLINVDDGKIKSVSHIEGGIDNILNCRYDYERQRIIILANKEVNGYLISVNSESGEINWTYKTFIAYPVAAKFVKPIIKDDYVYHELNGLTKINYETGEKVWEIGYNTFEASEFGFDKSITINSNAVPVFKEKNIFTGAKGRIMRLDSKTGSRWWQSADYDITPVIIIEGDTVFAFTGGILKRIKRGLSFSSFLTSMAIGMATGLATGVAIVPTPGSYAKEIPDVKELENISFEDFSNSIIWKGKPRVVACNLKDGSEIYMYQFEGDNKFSGYYVDFPEVIIGDKFGIHRFDLNTAGIETLFQLKDFDLGEQRYLLRYSNDEFVIISENSSGDQKEHYIAKVSLNSQEPVWVTRLEGISKLKAPMLLAQDSNNLYLIQDDNLILVDTGEGKVLWSQDLQDGKWGWSLSSSNESLAYYNEKDKKIYFCKLPGASAQ